LCDVNTKQISDMHQIWSKQSDIFHKFPRTLFKTRNASCG